MGHSFFNYRRGMEPVPGYTLLDRLGEGGFGEVWRANAPGHIPCALKIMDLTGKEGLLEFRSLRLVRSIDHANVNPITGIWLRDDEGRTVDEGQWSDEGPAGTGKGASSTAAQGSRSVELIIAMRLCMMSLHRLMQEYKKLGHPGIVRRELLVYMQDASRAIDYLNSAKHIVHSDIKPQNILVSGREGDQPGTASICDFGLARVIETLQKTQEAPVTVFYAAPEAFKGKSRAASDQYSLAITYVELRTGQLPFPSESQGSFWEIYEAHKSGQLDLSMLEPAEREVIARATHIDPEQRWKNCQEMVGQLREACERGGAPLEPIPVIELPEFSDADPLTEGSASSGDVTRYSPNAGLSGSGRPGTVFSLGQTTPAPPDSGAQLSATSPAQPLVRPGSGSGQRVGVATSDSAADSRRPPGDTNRAAGQATTLEPTAYDSVNRLVPGGAASGRSRRGIYAAAVVLMAAALGIGYFAASGWNRKPESGGNSGPAAANAADEIRQCVSQSRFDDAVRLLREQEGRLPQDEVAHLWKAIEEGWASAVDAALGQSHTLEEAERLFATGRIMKRSSLAPRLALLFHERVKLTYQGGNYSGAIMLLTDAQHPDRIVISQPDVDKIQVTLAEEWRQDLASKFESGALGDTASLAKFLLQLNPEHAPTRLWLGRALLKESPAQAGRTLDELRADQLASDEARALHQALRLLVAPPATEANAAELRTQGERLSAVLKLEPPYRLSDWEREQLAGRVASHVALATARAKALLAEGKGPEAEALLAAVAAADASNSEALWLQLDRFLAERQWEKALSTADKLAASAPDRQSELAPRRSIAAVRALPVLQLEGAVRSAQQVLAGLAADNAWQPQLKKALAECAASMSAEAAGLIQKPEPPPSAELAARLAVLQALGQAPSPELAALALEAGAAGSQAAEFVAAVLAAPGEPATAGYLKFVAAREQAAALAKANAPAAKWAATSQALRAAVPGTGELPTWVTLPRAKQLVELGRSVAEKRGLKVQVDFANGPTWLAEGFHPLGDAAQARELFELWRLAVRCEPAAGVAGDARLPRNAAFARDFAVAALYAEPAEPQLARTLLGPLVAADAVPNSPEALWNGAQALKSLVGTTNPPADEVMQRTLSLLSGFRALHPQAAANTPQVTAWAGTFLGSVVRPALQASRARTPADATDEQRALALGAAEFAWHYRSPEGWPAEPAAATMSEALTAAFTPAQATPRMLLLRAIGRLRQGEADPAGALADMKLLRTASAPGSAEHAAAPVIELAALAALPDLTNEQQVRAAAGAQEVTQHLAAKTLPTAELSLPPVKRLQAWALEAAGKYDEALAAYRELAGVDSGSWKAQLQADQGRCLAGKLRQAFPKLFVKGGSASLPDEAQALVTAALAELEAAIAFDAKSQRLAEPHANRARLLALYSARHGEAQQSYLQAVRNSVTRPSEAAVYLKEWAGLPLLAKERENEAAAAPAPEEISKLLSRFTHVEAKSYLRLAAVKANLRQLPRDPVLGEKLDGNFAAAKVYLDGYSPPSKPTAADVEWLQLRMAVNLATYNPERDSIRVLEAARNDADLLVDAPGLDVSARALVLASRGIANAIIANQDLQVQVARSAYRDLSKAVELEPNPPTRWRIHWVNSMAFAQRYAVESARPSQAEQQAALAQADKAIAELKQTGNANYASLIADLEKKKTAIRFPPRK